MSSTSMMPAEPWLDDLSEDWDEEPQPSHIEPTLPQHRSSTSSQAVQTRAESQSRLSLPKRNSSGPSADSHAHPLTERSANSSNIINSMRGSRIPSKLRNEILLDDSRSEQRSMSMTSVDSVVHNTIQHRPDGASSVKASYGQDTPEWRRRLLNGQGGYAEQKDLFAAGGLESLFEAPQPQAQTRMEQNSRLPYESDSVMPSSPPPYISQRQGIVASKPNIGSQRQRPQPRVMKYKLADSDPDTFSEAELSESSVFRPSMSASQTVIRPATALEEEDEEADDDSARDQSSQRGLPTVTASRTVSGSSEAINEAFSPVLLERNSSIGGSIQFSPSKLPLQLSRDTEQDELFDDLLSSEPDLLDSFHIDDEEPQVLLDRSANISTDFAHNGRFVKVERGQRGGHGVAQSILNNGFLPIIAESSILLEPPVDPGTSRDDTNSDEVHEEQNISAEKTHNTTHVEHRRSTTPPGQSDEVGKRPTSGVSPLKLFGNYDTWTNAKLNKTLSNLDKTFDQDRDDSYFATGISGRSDNQTAYTSNNLGSHGKGLPIDAKATTFGTGLEQFDFNQHTSRSRSSAVSQDNDEARNAREKPSFHFDLPPLDDMLDAHEARHRKQSLGFHTRHVHRNRDVESNLKIAEQDFAMVVHATRRIEQLNTPRKVSNDDAQGKRLRSPMKDSTPKRRRTLREGEPAGNHNDAGMTVETIQDTHTSMQQALGKKRKDARQGDDQQPADADVLANRSILKPRLPGHNIHDAHLNHEKHRHSSGNQFSQEQLAKIARVQAQLDGLEDSLQSFADSSGQPHGEGRQGSITTNDFIQDAKFVMANIRAKLHPSRLNNGDDVHDQEENEATLESTMEPFDRPPSREGGPLPRLPRLQNNPALLSHLQKFEDTNDMDIVLASSMKSVEMMKNIVREFNGANEEIKQTRSRVASRTISLAPPFESDPPNIHISEDPEALGKRKFSSSSSPADASEAQFESRSSTSSGPSTGRTALSGASKTSDNVKSIPPAAVSHLIPEEMAGMIFDRAKNAWVKKKIVSIGSHIPSDDSEGDPFGDIPDLTIDETRELARVHEIEKRKREEARNVEVQPYSSQRGADTVESSLPIPREHPRTSMAGAIELEPEITVDFHEHLHSSKTSETVQKTEPLIEHVQTTTRMQRKTQVTESENGISEEVEEEISIHESRNTPAGKKRRNVTISFSSPIASIIEPSRYSADPTSDAEESILRDNTSRSTSGQSLHSAKVRGGSMKRKAKFAQRSGSFIARPVSRIEEREEESVLETLEKMADGSRERSISVVITPAPETRSFSITRVPVIPTPNELQRSDPLLELSPLSDFTMHAKDESIAFEVSMLHQRQQRPHQARANNGNRSLTLSVKELVQSITDLEPYEPFWEHMKEMQLQSRRLRTTHMLDQFCERLEKLNIADNEIEQLDGLPVAIRHLRASHNMLSDITSWNALRNLQYLDVSNNMLTSLEGFKSLVHLRSLRADNNRIESLNGIKHLDGLITLRLRNNSIDAVDFRNTTLPKLADLDLKGNRIRKVTDLCYLNSLSNLNLEDNDLDAFPDNKECPTWGLKYLKLSGNRLVELDITNYQDLRVLYLDRNSISQIHGLHSTQYLDSLSLREQTSGTVLDANILATAFEVRKLFLSGNALGTFAPEVSYLNLQYLEIASCGLRKLPIEFAHRFPNVRTLNLNFNAIRDLRPLRGISRLKSLSLAGNRLRKADKVVDIVSSFPGLNMLDLRHNPFTHGFYVPACEKRRPDTSMPAIDKNDASETATRADHGSPADAMPVDVKFEPFVLEGRDIARDVHWEARLDIDTRIMRRVYEIGTVGRCLRLRYLDGAPTNHERVSRRDDVFEMLLEEGLVEVCEDESTWFASPQRQRRGDAPELQRDANNGHSRAEDSVIQPAASMRKGELAGSRHLDCRDTSIVPGITTQEPSNSTGSSPAEKAQQSAPKSVWGADAYDRHMARSAEESSIWPAEDSFA